MSFTLQVTAEQVASLLMINNVLLDITEQGAHIDILEEIGVVQPDLQAVLEQLN